MRLLSIIIGSIAYLFLVLWVNIYSALDFSIYILVLSIIVAFTITYILYRQYRRKLSLLKKISITKTLNHLSKRKLIQLEIKL